MVFGDGDLGGDWLGHEGRTLMNGIIALIKETPESSLTPSAMWEHSGKMAIYESGSGSSPDTKSAGALILDVPVSRTARNFCCL